MENDAEHNDAWHEQETLIELWRGVADRRSERRSYEWKVTVGLWGGILFLTNAVLAHPATFALSHPGGGRPIAALLIATAAIGVVLIHWSWLYRYIGPAHDSDRRQAIELEEKLRARLQLPLPSAADRRGMTNRASEFQLLVTVALSAVTVLLIARVMKVL